MSGGRFGAERSALGRATGGSMIRRNGLVSRNLAPSATGRVSDAQEVVENDATFFAEDFLNTKQGKSDKTGGVNFTGLFFVQRPRLSMLQPSRLMMMI